MRLPQPEEANIAGVMVFTRDTSLNVGVDKVFDELSVNKFLKRRCTVKEYYDAFTSSFNNKDLDEGSLLDAYSLAKLEETIHDLLKTKINSSSLHLSEAKDYSEVRNENFGLEGIDGVYEAAGKNRELESNESRIVDVKGVVNCEDGKGHGSEYQWCGLIIILIWHNHGERVVLRNVKNGLEDGVELTEFSPTGIGVHGHEYGFEDQLWNYEKHKESLVRNRKECDGEQEGNKEDGEWVLSVHLFGKCHDLRLIGNQEWVNEGGDIDIDIRGLNVNGFLAYIRDGDDLLNRQKKQKGDVVQFGMLEWPKMKKVSHVNFKFKSRSWKFDTWKWRKRKKVGGTECIFRHKKGNGDIWKWLLRKKDELESYTRLVEAKRALFRGEQQTSRPGSDVRRSSGGKVNYRTKEIFVGGLPTTLTEEQLRQYFGRYGDDGMKIVGLLGKLCEKQAQVVANDPLLMLVKGEIAINDRLQECSQIVFAEIAAQLQVGSELLVNVLEPRIGSLLKGRLEGGQLYTPAYVARVRGAARGITVPMNLSAWWSSLQLMLQEIDGASGVAVRLYELYPWVSVNGIEVLLISSTTLVFDPGGVKVFGGWDCKEGMRAYDKCLGLITRCWFKKDVPRLCIEKYLKMFCKDAKEIGVRIVSLNFEHGKWKFDVWRWPNRKKKWEETCYGVCLLSPACSKYLQPETLKELKDVLILVQRKVEQQRRSTTVEEILAIEIRPGWKKGTKITFPEKGNEQRGVIPSDLVFIIDEKPHAVFKRDGNDLVVTQKISLAEALTGYTAQITTLDGRSLTIPVNSVISPTYEEVVKGEGMPIPKEPTRKGNLRIKFDIKFPTRLTSDQKKGIKLLLTSS
ncbi:DnaJ homolog subfamily B member 1 [Tanacetum coccineum]